MIPRDLKGQRLTALAVLGWLLLTQPLLSIVDQPGRIFGIPLLYAWIFGAWVLLIVLIAVIVERGRSAPRPDPEP